MINRKRICVVTGTRAEYGLLRWVMEGVRQSIKMELQIAVTGMHLSPEYGKTVNEIESDGFFINRRVEMLLSSDTPVGVTKSIGLGMIGFADAWEDLKPDLILILGDRYEILSAAVAAMVARIPIAHLHGGEATEGLIDESIRHSITKMSHLHFVATEEYRQRVIQLGENPAQVFNVGGLGVDNIFRLKLMNRNDLEKSLNFKMLKHNLLITFHPVTLEDNSSAQQNAELLLALEELKDTGLIFTMPNADTNGRIILKQIQDFCGKNKNASFYTSLGHMRYLSCIKHCDGLVGNSSSGLTEAPSFKKGSINIGDRQRGRLKAKSVIDCLPELTSIRSALVKLFSEEFQKNLANVESPYGKKGASKSIIKILESVEFDGLLKKRFHVME